MADKSNNTGTGGINIGGNVITMDVGAPVDPNAQTKAWSSGDISVDKNVKDISQPTRDTFAKYMSRTTLGTVGASTHANVYPVGEGDNTTSNNFRIFDGNGLPAPLAPTSNPAKFADVNIGQSLPKGIKKGLQSGLVDDVDGNRLLSQAANLAPVGGPYIKASSGLFDGPVKSYTGATVDKNLYSVNSQPNENMADVEAGEFFGPNNLNATTKVDNPLLTANNLGTFDNIKSDAKHQVSKKRLQDFMTSKVKGQVNYADNPPNIPNEFQPSPANPAGATYKDVRITDNTGYPTSPTEAQNAAKNDPTVTNYFAKQVQSSYSVAASKLDAGFKRGKDDKPGALSGNQLLPGAASLAPPGGPYVKPSPGLVDGPVKEFTNEVVSQNLYAEGSADDKGVVEPKDFFGPKNLNATTKVDNPQLTDNEFGTFDNIKSNEKHKVTKKRLRDFMATQTKGLVNVPGNVPNIYRPPPPDPDPNNPEPEFAITAGGYPASPTEAQNSVTPGNSSYFAPPPKLKSSYSDESTALDASFPKFKRGKSDKQDAIDGHTLLPAAAAATQAGSPYVKPSLGLAPGPVESYTNKVLEKNLYVADKTDDKLTVETGDFFGPENLNTTSKVDVPTLTDDELGTFDNIKTNEKHKVTKKRLQDYMVTQTKGQVNVPGAIPNQYRPPQSNFDFSINDDKGYPKSPTSAQNADKDNASYYAPGVASSYTDSVPKIDDYLKRGKNSKSGAGLIDGNSLLKDAAVPKEKNLEINVPGVTVPINAPITVVEQSVPIKSYVSDVLTKNRFVSEQQFATYEFINGKLGDPPTAGVGDSGPFSAGSSRESFDKTAAFPAPKQLKLGESLDPKIERSYNFRKLSKVGQILQLRATGEFISTENRNLDPSDPNNALPVPAWLPGAGQLGAGVPLPMEYLDVEGILRDIEGTPANDDTDAKVFNASLISFNNKFEGVINSTFEKFSGFTAIGMIALVVTLVIAIVAAISFFGLIFSAGSPSNFSRNDAKNIDRIRGLGAFYGPGTGGESPNDIINAFLPTADNSVLFRFFGIMPTNQNFAKATFFGALAFFGVDENYNPVKTFQSPGFYTTMCRSVVRSAVAIGLAFKEMVDTFSSGNIGGGIESIFETLGILKNSRVFAAMNVFAQLGDYQGYEKYDRTIAKLDAGQRISEIDSALNDAPIFKSRLNGTDGRLSTKLAWASNRVPGITMISTKAYDLSQNKGFGFGDPKLITSGLGDANAKNIFVGRSSKDNYRISTQDRELIENRFDTEYMPFYFHDLRTNEIIGFHAFLGSLSDAYSPKYESTEGFGRMDPVMVYRNTTRKIGFDFYLAALDEKDFDYMWEKINKLTTMVYPQYTQGKRLGISTGQGNYIFTRPFTQQIGAAPMVRIRLGDILKSNYSKFNLARIFGGNDDTTQMASLPSGTNDTTTIEEINALSGQNNRNLIPGDTILLTDDHVTFATNEGGGFLSSYNNKKFQISKYREAFEFQIETIQPPVSAAPGEPNYYKGKFVFKDKVNPSIDEATASAITRYKADLKLDSTFGTFGGNLADVEKETFYLPISDRHSFGYKTLKRFEALQSTAKQRMQGYDAQLLDFLDEKKNSITRSFKSAGGKGLAGFIDSLSFDWMDRITWEISPGRKAPKMCKISIGFSPIHDLQPGLAHDGYNIAPIYGVGPFSARTPPGQSEGKD